MTTPYILTKRHSPGDGAPYYISDSTAYYYYLLAHSLIILGGKGKHDRKTLPHICDVCMRHNAIFTPHEIHRQIGYLGSGIVLYIGKKRSPSIITGQMIWFGPTQTHAHATEWCHC
eukprot:scaffold31001_cov23-Prasinocladus_malaysianus.AAC.1